MYTPKLRLQNKVAIVIGAGCVGPGWGNGRAIAVRFAQEGARVFAVDRNADAMAETAEMIREFGGEFTQHIADVTDSSQIAALVDACLAKYGTIDILINNVGGPLPGGPVALSEDNWHQQLDINLTYVFLTCKYVLPIMEAKGSGAIVNIASISGIRFSGAAQVGYAASKAGVIQFGRVVAVEYAKKGVRINTVLPGQLHTPLVDKILARTQADGDLDSLLKRRQARIPMSFTGDGRDTANAALFLASDEARFITGTELIVDGGMTAKCD